MAAKTKREYSVNVTQSTELTKVILSIPKTLTFEVDGVGERMAQLDKCHAGILTRFLVRGAYERTKDNMAINRADAGLDARVLGQMKLDNTRELWDHFESGTEEYTRRGASGGGGRSIAVEAFAQDLGIEYAEAKLRAERIAESKGRSWTDQLNVLRKLYADAIRKIEEARAAEIEIDADAEMELLRNA